MVTKPLCWAEEVLEAGYKIRHEPESVVIHSHNYSYLEILQRNFDDGIANREFLGRRLDEGAALHFIQWLAREDWRFLEEQRQLSSSELEHWRMAAVLRRTAQMIGQWIGTNQDRLPVDLSSLLSITDKIKAAGNAPIAVSETAAVARVDG